MATREELEALLPAWCYASHPVTGEPVIVRRFEDGYTPLELEVWPRQANGLMGISEEQELAMLTGSLFGWANAGADPRTFLKWKADQAAEHERGLNRERQ
jgi:hypothetical protein